MTTSEVSRAWTTPADAVRVLRRKWESGSLLTRFAAGQQWEPISVPLRGPTATDIATNFGAAQDWVRNWLVTGSHGFRVESAPLGGRVVGRSDVPRRAWVDSYEQAWRLLKVAEDVRSFDSALALIDSPRLGSWARSNPMTVLAATNIWADLIRTVTWIDAFATADRYVREIDVPGIDTKFIEQHRGILSSLLDVQLSAERVDLSRPRSDFSGRYGLRSKPEYVRLRSLGGDLIGDYTELTLRLDEIAHRPPTHATVVIVENETTYLALPDLTHAIAICSGGYAVSRLAKLPWLSDRRVVYWGDLDTHGFAMLSQLRASLPHAVSMLMDTDTLLAHEAQWVREPKPTNARLPGLNEAEHRLYVDLIEDRYAVAVRLEQERIGFGLVRAAMARLSNL